MSVTLESWRHNPFSGMVGGMIASFVGGATIKGLAAGLIAEIPQNIMHLNPEVKTIGALSLVAIIIYPKLKQPAFKKLSTVIVAIGLSMVVGIIGIESCYLLRRKIGFSRARYE